MWTYQLILLLDDGILSQLWEFREGHRYHHLKHLKWISRLILQVDGRRAILITSDANLIFEVVVHVWHIRVRRIVLKASCIWIMLKIFARKLNRYKILIMIKLFGISNNTLCTVATLRSLPFVCIFFAWWCDNSLYKVKSLSIHTSVGSTCSLPGVEMHRMQTISSLFLSGILLHIGS